MRHTFFFIIFLQLILWSFSCTPDNDTYKRLVAIDTLSDTRPDSARQMLAKMKQEERYFSEKCRASYRLLCIKADDKSYIRHRNDSGVPEMIDYYQKHGSPRQLTIAYYYAASVYRDMNNTPVALEYFQETEKAMPEDMDKKFKSNLFNQTGRLFLYQNFYRKALQYYIRSYNYDMQRNDTAAIVYSSLDIANAYRNSKKYDKCLFFLNKAEKLTLEKRDTNMLMHVLGQKAIYYEEKKDHKNAYKCFKRLPREIGDNESTFLYSLAIDIYFNIGQKDKAKFYCDKMLKYGNVYGKKQAYKILSKLYFTAGEPHKAYKCLDSYEMYSDSVDDINAIEEMSQSNARYNFQRIQTENAQLKADRLLLWNSILIGILIFIIISVIAYQIIIRQRKKKQEYARRLALLDKKTKEQAEMSESRICSLKESIQVLSSQMATTQNMNKALKEEISILTKDLAEIENKKAYRESRRNAMFKSEAYKTMMNRLKQGKSIKKQDWENIYNDVSTIIPEFKTNLQSIYPVNENEYRFCILLFLDIAPIDISTLLCLTKSGVSMFKRRLHDRIFGKNGNLDELNELIKSL